MKKIIKKTSKIFLGLFCIIITVMVILTVRHRIESKKDKALYKDAYGQYFTLQSGERINYTFYDSPSDEVAVILPGFGCASVHYDFDTLAKNLKDQYKIIQYEPLGYGLSDKTTRQRSTENYCLELHEFMKGMGYDRYTLIGHSIAGLYALKYSNMYPEEVNSFIGIDASVPHQSEYCEEYASPEGLYKTYKIVKPVLINTGIYRLLTELTYSSTLESIPTLSKDDRKKALAMNCTDQLNDTQMNEVEEMAKNFDDCYDLKFPESVPVLYMLADSNCKEIPQWDDIHKEIITSPEGRVEVLKGNHYLYLSNLEGVVDGIKAWNIQNN